MEVNVSAGGPAPPAPPESPKPQPMAFTIEFEGARAGDAARRELLARSQARRQRVQSASGGAHRPSPGLAPQKPPMSAKLPRKAQGYNSEGYFSSDQEDSVLSGSVKLKRSPLAQSNDLFKPHNIKSPVFDVKKNNFSNCTIEPIRMNSKSPIVDSIMSRSDTLPSRHGLNLPLKPMHSSSYANMQQSPSYSTLSSSYSKRNVLCDIIDQSPDGLMLTDISSPEMDMLTPENVLSSPEYKVKSPKMDYKSSSPKTDSQMSSSKDCKISSPKADYKISSPKADYKISSPQLDYKISSPRFSPKKEMPDLFKKCVPKNELEILEDCDKHSDNSSTGTYTIEGDNYTEEQKARMSIDRTFGVDLLKTSLTEAMQRRSLSKERDPELVLDLSEKTKEYHQRDICLSPLNRTFEKPKVSTEKNVLEIMCCYESPDETDLATQTSNQIKSTRNYLEKIKSRVRTISEKTFQKLPQKSTQPQDEGSFTSVTTSGVLSSKFDLYPEPRRVSLTQSQIDKTDYVHRLTRESSVPVSLPSAKKTYEDPKTIPPFQDNNFESEVLRNAHAKTFKDTTNDDSGILDVTPEQVVGKLSYLSLNRCKGDKTWIQEWADSVKKYNSDALGKTLDLNSTFVLNSSDRPPASPRHQQQVKCATVGRSGHSAAGTLTKIPSPVHSRPVQEILSCNSDTESYLLRTQSAITNLQAKLHTKTTSPISNLPPLMTTSFVSEKTAASRLPVSQLSRSNSLNYRLRKRDNSADSSPLRSPGNYVITGSGIPTSTKLLLAGASRSLDTEPRYPKLDSNMNSPERCTYSNSSDEKTLSNKMYEGHVKTHARHRSFDGHNIGDFIAENDNVLGKVSLKTVLKNNAFEAQRTIEPTRCLGNRAHVRVYSDSPKVVTQMKPLSNTIRRSSSFNTVNRNNNYIEPKFKSTNQSGNINEYAPKDTDYLSDESDSASYPDLVKPQPDLRYNRAMILRRERLESPNLKSIAPANSPRCPNTPEMIRKFGPGLVRNSGRVTNQKALNSRLSEPPRQIDREKTPGQQGRKISDTTRLEIVNRLTKSRSSTRDFGPKNQEKGGKKKPNQHRSSTSLASKEVEFTNWKKRSSYDPMKAAQEGKRRQQQRMQECNKDDLSSPSHSSPVHRSQSFHSTNMADLAALDYSSEETEDDQMVSALPMDHPMISSTHSDILEVRRKSCEHRDAVRRRPVKNDVALTRDYVAHFKINHPPEKLTPHRDRDIDKRKTFIIDDKTPVRDDVDRGTNMENTFTIEHNGRAGEKFRIDKKGECNAREDIGDKRRTFILDSDTNSTTNGSSPRNSSIFSHEKNSLTTTGTSDTEGESGTESAPVVMRKKGTPAQSAKRHSGDYSVSSSTTSASQPRRSIQPRYLDISKYKNESSPKNFLRKDPSKTYIAALGPGHAERAHSVTKSSAREHEMEQKKQELEKWKRRASYDPRKAAALGKSGKTPPKTASSVIRSQSFNGPVLSSSMSRYTAPHQIPETYDQSSDNDF